MRSPFSTCVSTGLLLLALTSVAASLDGRQLATEHAHGAAAPHHQPAGFPPSGHDDLLPPTTPDIPEGGYSAFDALFTVVENGMRRYEVPFPFTKLTREIERALGDDSLEGTPTLKSTLIPFSRCMGRTAAHPDYFTYPRVVVATDSEPLTFPSERPVWLKDRLFLGYQPKANALEVISYNEVEGRFEFQTVTDYAQGMTPSVRYVERARCLACHRNAGPIFPLTPWNETNVNPAIAMRITLPEPYARDPVPWAGADAYAIDRATDRAGLFVAAEFLWGELCAGGREHTIRCRAGAFQLVLARRLGVIIGAYAPDPLVTSHFVPTVTARFVRTWPDGIRVAMPDLSDPGGRRLSAVIPLTAEIDPELKFLPPQLLLPQDLPRMLNILSDFIPLSDLRHLDAVMFDRGRMENRFRWRSRGKCRMQRLEDRLNGGLASMECRLSDGIFGRTYNLLGDVSFVNRRTEDRGGQNRFLLSERNLLAELAYRGGTVEAIENAWEVRLEIFNRDGVLRAWLPGGVAVESIEINWPRVEGSEEIMPVDEAFIGNATITLTPGYEMMTSAISRMVERAVDGKTEVFGDAFRGARLMQVLLGELGVATPAWCCDDSVDFPFRQNLPRGSFEGSVLSPSTSLLLR